MREIHVLNRVLRLTPDGYRLEADPRHAEAVVRDLGLVGAKFFKLPGSKEEKRKHFAVGDHVLTLRADELAPIWKESRAPQAFDGFTLIGDKPATSIQNRFEALTSDDMREEVEESPTMQIPIAEFIKPSRNNLKKTRYMINQKMKRYPGCIDGCKCEEPERE
mgnify:CR=1 FL=1